MKPTTPIQFVYPYVNNEDKFEELRYSLRSLEKHFTEPFNVVIVGDMPGFINPDLITYIPVDRLTQVPENITADAIFKMLTICDSELVEGIFIRIYDDVYLLKDMGIDEIGKVRAMKDMNHTKRLESDGSSSDTWQNQLWHTYDVVRAKNRYGWNFETHLPEVFVKSVMKFILTGHDAMTYRLLISTLYNNICWDTSDPHPDLINRKTNIRAGFYGVSSEYSYKPIEPDEYRQAIKGKMFLNHNDDGLTKTLIQIIRELFPKPSRFEK